MTHCHRTWGALAVFSLWLPLGAQAAPCSIANPVLPCEIGSTVYDTFAGNFTQNRSFYIASSYETSIADGYLSLMLRDGLPHSNGYAYVTGYYGPTVWTSPPPYNAEFKVFGQFNGSGVELANNFSWLGSGAPQPPAPFNIVRPIGLPDQPGTNRVTFDGTNYLISVNIGLTGDSTSQSQRTTWESGIEQIWSDQFNLSNYAQQFPIKIAVNFLPGAAPADVDFTVSVRDEFCRSSSLIWCTQPMTDNSGNPRLDMAGQLAAHEFGHLLGLYDEYSGGGTSPGANPDDLCTYALGLIPVGSFCGSLMADFGPIKERYFSAIEAFIEGATSQQLVLAPNPLLNSYAFVDPGPDFNGIPEGPIGSPVPEPSAAILFGIGLAGLARSQHIRRQRAILAQCRPISPTGEA